MKRLVRKADFSNNGDYNVNLYQEGTVESGELILKDEIIESIMDNMDVQGESEFTPELRSRDYYTQDEAADATLSCEGTLDISVLENTFGEFTENDITVLEEELKDSEAFKDFLIICLEDIKDHNISTFKLGNVEISIKNKLIDVEAEADDIELNAY